MKNSKVISGISFLITAIALGTVCVFDFFAGVRRDWTDNDMSNDDNEVRTIGHEED